MKITFPLYNIYFQSGKPNNTVSSPIFKPAITSDTVSFTSKERSIPLDNYMERLDKLEAKLKKKVSGEELCILKNIYFDLDGKNLAAVEKIADIQNFPKKYLFNFLMTNRNNSNYNTDIVATAESYNDIYHRLHRNHEHFLTFSSPQHRKEIDYVFNNIRIVKLASLHDSDLNRILIDKKSDKFRDYTKMIDGFSDKSLDILRQSLKCKTPKGRALKPNQKLELVEMMEAYRVVHSGLNEFAKMSETGIIDTQKLKENLLFQVMKVCGYSDNELRNIPKDKLQGWDMNYIHLLVKPAVKYGYEFSELVQLANEDCDFKTLLHDEFDYYGKVNCATKQEFDIYGLNYEKWLNPSKEHNVTLKSVDDNSSKLKDAANDYLKNVNVLMKNTHINNFISKKYNKCVQNDEFIFPSEICSNKQALVKFMNNFIQELKPVWDRAERNSKHEKVSVDLKSEREGDSDTSGIVKNLNDLKVQMLAKHTLTIKDHLETIARTTESIPVDTNTQEIDLTIKMWDRIPQKDLFQGNYSTCCIGMGAANDQAMPMYLMNTAFNMIELVDNISGNTVGNALCYFALDMSKNPIFVIDNIEINNNYKPNEENCKKIRNAIKEYIQNINNDISPNNDIPIYIGNNYNDVPDGDLEPLGCELVTVLGKVMAEEVYLDSFNGWLHPHIKYINGRGFGIISDNIDLKALN